MVVATTAGVGKGVGAPLSPAKCAIDADSTSVFVDSCFGEPVSHEGRIHVDQVAADRWVVTDTVTFERFDLSAGPWEVVVHPESGRAAVCKVGGGSDFIVVDEKMKLDLFVLEGTGEEWIIESRDGDTHQWSLSTRRCRFRDGKTRIRLGCAQGSGELDVFVFDRPRSLRSRVFFSMHSVYSLLGFDQFKGQASKWVYNSMKSWELWVQLHIGTDQFVRSTAISKEDGPFHERCLPVTSASTLALLLLLVRFALVSRERGGCTKGAHRAASLELLTSFLEAASNRESWRFKVFAEAEWSSRWPRPNDFESWSLSMVVDSGGNLDMQSWADALATPGCAPALVAVWWKQILPIMSIGSSKIGLLAVLKAVAGQPKLRSFVGQLCMAIAWRLETCWAKHMTGKLDLTGPVSFEWAGLDEMLAGSFQVDRKMYSYVQNSREATVGVLNISVATDKGQVGGLPLQNTVVCLANNRAFWCCPQVDRGFDDEDRRRTAAPKETKGSASTTSEPSTQARHLAWLQRGRPSAKASAWRPKPIFRVSAKRWLTNLDNQLRVSTVLPAGLGTFVPDDGRPLWMPSNWRRWPHITISSDLGSDGLTATSALLYSFQANASRFADPSHGCARDNWVVLKGCGLYQYFLLMCVSFNLPYGRDKDDSRWHQIRDAVQALKASHDCKSSVLFQERVGVMYNELVEGGVQFDGEGPRDEEVWNFWAKRESFQAKGVRVNLNRFQNGIVRASQELMWWTMNLFEREFVGLETDILKGKKLVQRLVLRPGEAEEVPEGGGTTSNSVVTVEDRSLRNCAESSMVISIVMLGDYHNRRLLQCIVAASKHVVVWHTKQNRQLRSAPDSLAWLKHEVSVGFMNHISDGLSVLESRQTMEECGFLAATRSVTPEDPEILVEDEFAMHLSRLVLAYSAARQRRCLYYFSWPMRMVKCLVDPELASRTIDQFMSDYKVFELLGDISDRTARERNLYNRHVMQHTVNKQYRHAITEFGGMSDDLAEVLRQHNSGVLCTQSVEDCIGAQKNAGQVKQCQEYRKTEVSMAAAIKSETLEVRHRYAPISAGGALPNKSCRLDDTDFRANPGCRSRPWQSVVSTNPVAGFYSPSATNSTTPDGDLGLLRDAAAAGDVRLASKAWLGCLFDYKHEFVWEHTSADGSKMWVLPLVHLPDSAVLAHRCEKVSVAGCNEEFFTPLVLDAPVTIGVFELGDHVRGCSIKARSWMWQLANLQNCAQLLTPAIRFFRSADIEPVHKLACRSGFWKLSRPVIQDIARYFSIAIPEGQSMLDLLTTMASSLLGASEEETLRIAHRRVVMLNDDTLFSEELLKVDDAIQLLDSNDHEEFCREQKAAQRTVTERDEVSAESHRRATELRVRAAKSKSKDGKRRRVGDAPGAKFPKVLPPISTIPQAHAKLFIPPGSSIWRGLGRGEWWGHFAPYSRTRAAWSRYREAGAMHEVIKRLWRQHNQFHGHPLEECPISGVFEQPAASGAASSSAGT